MRKTGKTISCSNCGKPIYRPPWRLNLHRHHFCDKSCQYPRSGQSCSYEECGYPSRNRGLCNKHYLRWRKYHDPSVVKHKHALAEDYFRTMSEHSAYILGLMVADGCIRVRRDFLYTIQFTSKDIELVDYVRRQWKSTAKIYEHSSRGTHNLQVHSKMMVNDLAALYVVPRKTFKTQYPPIASNLDRHFIRGVLDGDGCVHIRKDGGIQIIFYGTKQLLDSIADRFSAIGLNSKQSHESIGNNTFRLSYGAKDDAHKICEFLYALPCPMFLKRKRDKLFFALRQPSPICN